jgi:hypothetical protein
MTNPKKGDIAYCGLNSLGLITQDAPKLIQYKDGTEAMVYVGIHLTDKIAPIGTPWSSKHPRVIGTMEELLKILLDKCDE